MDYVYSIYDAKQTVYIQPFFARNDASAIRILEQTLLSMPDCLLTQYPEDFTVFRIGDWDANTGVITKADAFVSLGTCLQLISQMRARRAQMKPAVTTDKPEAENA